MLNLASYIDRGGLNLWTANWDMRECSTYLCTQLVFRSESIMDEIDEHQWAYNRRSLVSYRGQVDTRMIKRGTTSWMNEWMNNLSLLYATKHKYYSTKTSGPYLEGFQQQASIYMFFSFLVFCRLWAIVYSTPFLCDMIAIIMYAKGSQILYRWSKSACTSDRKVHVQADR